MIKTITISPSINPSCDEDKQLIDTLLTFLSKNESELVCLQSLNLQKKYKGHLTIPTFAFELKQLQIGSTTGLTIKSQSCLETITIDCVNNDLIIEEQKELQELSMHCIEQGRKGAKIAIQPKLSSLQINVLHGELSLENQPCLQKIEVKRVWAGPLMITAEQKKLLSSNTCLGQTDLITTIMITKSQKELEKPVPLSNLLTMDHLLSVISVNEKVYIAAVLACIWLDDPTLFCIGSLLLIVKNIIQEMQRIYSNEKGMMYIS